MAEITAGPMFHVKDAVKNLKWIATIHGVRQFGWRVKLGARLIQLAAWVMWCDIEVIFSED